MLLLTVIVILLIWAAVVSSIYSSFLVFYSNFSQTENYHKAYYAAIAALERAELVVKQRWAWFQWSGWWNASWNIISWSHSDYRPPALFSYLSEDSNRPSTLQRSITSRTKRIPQIWQWDVDRTIFSWASIDYNKMDYENAEIFLLYYDNWSSSDAYKNNVSYTGSNIQKISGTIRLPKLSGFSLLDDNHPLFGVVNDDAIVDWQLRGKYNSNDFTIYATQKLQQTAWNRFKPTAGDSAIRESDLNSWATLTFWNNKNPKKSRADSSSTFTIISPDEQQIASLYNFKEIFNNSSTSNLSLRLALLNLLKSDKNLIYPYLEYYLDFWEVEVSDKYFHINAEWKFWDYQVNLLVDKPTVKESILWSFTVVF